MRRRRKTIAGVQQVMRTKIRNLKTLKRLLALLAAVVVISIPVSLRGQKRPAPRSTTIDYSKFSHSTKKHQGACDTCHKIPTSGWQKVSGIPDVNDFPEHQACVSCHRNQFSKDSDRRSVPSVTTRHHREMRHVCLFAIRRRSFSSLSSFHTIDTRT